VTPRLAGTTGTGTSATSARGPSRGELRSAAAVPIRTLFPFRTQTVYLVPEFEDDDKRKTVIGLIWSELFEREHYGWHLDPTDWPQNRTLAMFREWFRIEMHTIIEDLVDGPIKDDGLEED